MISTCYTNFPIARNLFAIPADNQNMNALAIKPGFSIITPTGKPWLGGRYQRQWPADDIFFHPFAPCVPLRQPELIQVGSALFRPLQLPEKFKVDSLRTMQGSLRKTPAEMADLKAFIKNQGLPGKVILTCFPDGNLFVRDGIHRLTALKDLGLDLPREACELEFYDYDDFLRLMFFEDTAGKLSLADSWLTPMDPRKHFRHPQLVPYKRFIETLYNNGTNPKLISDFIHAHPELYRSNRDSVQSLKIPDRDWESYLRRMQQSMGIKIAQLLTLIPNQGIVYDIGCGSGDQSFTYAKLFPELLLAGLDMAQESIGFAQANFQSENLLYMKGNACEPFAIEGSASGIIASSTEHEIFSFSGFDRDALRRFYQTCFAALEPGGKFGSRDFVAPQWPNTVRIKLPTTPESGEGDFGKMSRAELFRHYASNFITTDYPKGVSYQELPCDQDGWTLFDVDGRAAANFMHRMEYRKNWLAELKEQYLYWSLEEKIQELKQAGFRIDFAVEVDNTWICLNWWRGRVFVTDTDGNRIDLPPNNAIFHCIKPGANDPLGLEISNIHQGDPASRFSLRSYSSADQPRQIFDVIHVDQATHHKIVFERGTNGDLLVYTRNLTEVPSLRLYSNTSALRSARYSGYTNTGFIGNEFPASAKSINDRSGHPYFPIPGISDEVVTPHFVEIQPGANLLGDSHLHRDPIQKLLGACHTGFMPDGRQETALYQLARQHNVAFLPWLDGDLPLSDQQDHGAAFPRFHSCGNLPSKKDYPQFVTTDKLSGFAEALTLNLVRTKADGTQENFSRELLAAKNYSSDTFSVVPYVKLDGEVYVGFETRHLAAVQSQYGSSGLSVIPAWRLPKNISGRVAANKFLREKMAQDFDIGSLHVTPLGAGYFPSAHNTPEKVTPFAVELDANHPPRDLSFVPLKELLEKLDHVPDLHSQIGLYRLAHALNLLPESDSQRG